MVLIIIHHEGCNLLLQSPSTKHDIMPNSSSGMISSKIFYRSKENILKELKFMGIHEKSIYGNYDHIASYIRNKF